jgi:hypothetical protein
MDKKELKNVPILDDGQVYIYVLKNSANSIKVGKTTNLLNRIQSLSGSNGAGEVIVNVYCSPATWLHNIEKIAHEHFSYARMSGEWFDGTKVTFDSVVKYVNGLFESKDYKRCNELRRKIIEEKRDIGK